MMSSIDRAKKCLIGLEAAVYRAATDVRGTIGAIAEKHGFNANTLALKINPNREGHNVNLRELEAILGHTRDPRIMDAICAAHGAAGWYPLPESDLSNDQACEFFESFGELSGRVGELGKSLFKSLADGRIDDDEYNELQKVLMQINTAGAALIAAADKKRKDQSHV